MPSAVAAAEGAGGVSVVFAGTVLGAAQRRQDPHLPARCLRRRRRRPDRLCGGQAACACCEPGPLRSDPAGRRRPACAGGLAAGWRSVMNHAGATGASVRALVADGVRGLVAAGTGNGFAAPRRWKRPCWRRRRQGVAVRRASRCPQGPVLPHPEGPPAAGRRPVAGEGPHRADAGTDDGATLTRSAAGSGGAQASLRRRSASHRHCHGWRWNTGTPRART